MANDFFQQRPQIHPTIYAYSLVGVASHNGYLKVGFTERDVDTRVKEQVHTVGVPFKIHLRESAMRTDGTCFTDHDVHAILRRRGFRQLNAGEDRKRCSQPSWLGRSFHSKDKRTCGCSTYEGQHQRK